MKNSTRNIPLLIVFAFLILLGHLIYLVVSNENKCKQLGGTPVRGACISNTVVIDV